MEAEKILIIKNKLGLHARAAAQLVKVANRFTAEIFITKDKRQANAKSIMGVLTLAAAVNSKVRINCHGDDAMEALAAISDLFEQGFGEL